MVRIERGDVRGDPLKGRVKAWPPSECDPDRGADFAPEGRAESGRPMGLQGCFLLGLFLAVATGCAPLPGPTPSSSPTPGGEGMTEHSPVQVPRGLADPGGQTLYLMDLEDLIHLVDPDTGSLLARTTFPARPLTLVDDLLIAWAPGSSTGTLRLVAVQQQGGELRSSWETPLELPGWVQIQSPESEQFTIHARVQDGQITVTWEARSGYSGGAPPPPEVAEAQTRSERRTLLLDPEAGTVLEEGRPGPAPTSETTLPELPPGEFIVPYRRDGEWATHAWRVDSLEAHLIREAGAPGILLVHRGGDLSTAGERHRLSSDPGAEAMVTPDGRWIFVHEPGAPDPSWAVFSAETARPVTRLPFEPGTAEVAVLDGRVLYLVVEERGGGRRHYFTRCRRLDSGEVKWSYSLGEETLRAPPPLRP